MTLISSRQNPAVKTVCALHDAKERKAQQRFIAEGLRTISTFAQHAFVPEALYVTPEMQKDTEQAGIKNFQLVTDDVMKKMSASSTPSGILAVFKIPQPAAGLTSGLVLAQISDPGNMGTLIRTCAAMGFKTVVVVEGTDLWSPKVIQASAGTIALVQIFQWTWKELIEKKGSITLCALVVAGGKQPEELDLSNSLLVVGSEAHGLPPAWTAQCEQKMTIAMPGNTESLNAAVAGSIALYLSKNCSLLS